MRHPFLVPVYLIAALGCNLSNLRQQNSNLVDQTRPTPLPDVSSTPAPSASPTPAPKPPIGSMLKKSVGKYPYEIKMLDIPDLQARLQKLMGKDFAAMKKYWNVETPIEIDGSKLKMSGCQAHNCSGNMYVMFIDLDEDNVNIYHLNDDGVTKTYFEKGKIILPPKFADEIDVVDR
jgi:hypothetical protein